jgi:GH15 family glucan-1,4-alpha-glucosidase
MNNAMENNIITQDVVARLHELQVELALTKKENERYKDELEGMKAAAMRRLVIKRNGLWNRASSDSPKQMLMAR